jgi:hypothetical protein
MPKRTNYRVTWNPPNRSPVVVEGLANNRGHACRLAFKKLIEAGYMAAQPKTSPEGGFEHVKVEVIKEDHEGPL